jgi:hypothetical protein
MAYRGGALASLVLVGAACGTTIPKVESARCALGVADGNDGYAVRQPVACRMIAQRLAADDRPDEAMGYARKACQLEDAAGCQEYLELARARPSLPPDELLNARAAGEKACAGIVVATDGTDARPALCVDTAELYLDVEPRSRSDAGRLYARACKLGDDKSCARAKSLGVEPEESPAPTKPPPRHFSLNAGPTAVPAPPSPPRSSASPPPHGPPPCHEMRDCVTLELHQRNISEVVGTMTSHCDVPVLCTWCPSHGSQVDRSACRSATFAPNESKSGREAGLWYDGFNAMAYDCMGVNDEKGCLSP